jgi:hypothetical protein
MKTAPDATRHRLLEGVLLRLARLPDAGGLVLRGGVLLRHWFRPLPRPARDLDLVAPAPLTTEEASHRYLPLFAVRVSDGVNFDADQLHVEGIWQHTDNPGVRVVALGEIDGDEAEVQVDITGGPRPRPAQVLGDLPTASGEVARVWMCRPEAVVGQKLQALWQHGVHCWRPKDLEDLRLLLARVPMNAADLSAAIVAYLADVGGTVNDARALFEPSSWWSLKLSVARWLDFARLSQEQEVPSDLGSVVEGIAGALGPILEGLP